MSQTILILCLDAPPPGSPAAREALMRAVFEAWWAGAEAVGLGDPAQVGEWPMPLCRVFSAHPGAPLPWRLRAWLFWRRQRPMVVAGPGAATVVEALAAWGHTARILDEFSRPSGPPVAYRGQP